MINIWELITISKQGEDYVSPEKQYKRLFDILKDMDKDDVKRLYNEWNCKEKELINSSGFELLNKLVKGGDDTFFMDFSNWAVAQGEEFFNEIQKEGMVFLKEYIDKHNVSRSEYTYECMIYVFHNFLD